MKALLILSLAVVTVAPASAQNFRPSAGRGSPHHGHFDRGNAHRARPAFHHGAYIYRHRPSVHVGIGPAYYPSYYPAYGYYPGYGVDYPYYGNVGYYGSGSSAASGLWLGALAGGIIGNNSGTFGHNGWRGAAWGAGLGWLLGSVADANRRSAAAYEQPPVVVSRPAPVVTVPAQPAAASTAPQQVTIINNYYNSSTPMSGANGLFGR